MEKNQIRSRGELTRDSGRKVAEIVTELERKTTDARKDANERRFGRNKWRKKVESIDGISKGQVHKMIGRLRNESEALREELKTKNKKTQNVGFRIC